MSNQTELNQYPENQKNLPSDYLPGNNPILTYLASLCEESLIGKMSTYGFLCSTNWWPTE